VVEYDTIIELPSVPGLKPGMSADVEVTIEQHENVLTVPVDAVVQTAEGTFCWVKTANGATQRRALQLGDTDGQSVVVKAGLQEGDEVWLDSLTAITEAQVMALTPFDSATQPVTINQEVNHVN
jgi:multidrug efflux pump subunit AcrA (membrane-fusion protein)